MTQTEQTLCTRCVQLAAKKGRGALEKNFHPCFLQINMEDHVASIDYPEEGSNLPPFTFVVHLAREKACPVGHSSSSGGVG